MSQPSVCIVDDEKELADTYCDYLRDTYSVRPFFSAEEALREFDKNYSPDLIVTDIKMPKVTGLDFIDRLRKNNVHTPVIVMSGYADKSHALKAIEREVFGFLEKPFDPEQLRALLGKASHKFLSKESNDSLLRKYGELSKLNFQLLRHYRERFQTAENVLYEANILLQKNPIEVKRFLTSIHTEAALEKDIERVTKDIQNLSQTFVLAGAPSSSRGNHEN